MTYIGSTRALVGLGRALLGALGGETLRPGPAEGETLMPDCEMLIGPVDPETLMPPDGAKPPLGRLGVLV